MKDSGLKPAAGELGIFNFMNKRAEAFDRNELNPDSLEKILEGIGTRKKPVASQRPDLSQRPRFK